MKNTAFTALFVLFSIVSSHGQKADTLSEVVVSGTLKEVDRLESPVPVEVFNPTFFKKNPTPSVFESLQLVNGVRPQLNCNVCNTGDIHINGMEGPYTMVLIDGMPIVSGLSTVYGLMGIPQSLIERIEVVKGPASSLYGSEAVAGLINVITRKNESAPAVSAEVFGTSWAELNGDLGFKLNAGKSASVLTGINYFKYGNRIDRNHDGFTDMTLQDRLSVFQKWNFKRAADRVFTLGGRYLYEDRWGGQTGWTRADRGSGYYDDEQGREEVVAGDGRDPVYGESIYTKRWELIGNYQLPVDEKMMFMFSYNDHDQNSRYGVEIYNAVQRIAFGQLTWDKKAGGHDLLGGLALRYTYYADHTGAGRIVNSVEDRTWLPGLFVQDEIALSGRHKLLLGMRYDHHSSHGNIFTPRLAWKWSVGEHDILRLNAGTGFRVVNLFTEDHAALTGAREIVVPEELKPEKSYNANLNYIKHVFLDNGSMLVADVSAWYTYFDNRITPDFDSSPGQIIYSNLRGHGVSRGLSVNLDMTFVNGLKVMAGASLLDNYNREENEAGELERVRPVHAEKWTGTWAVSYTILPWQLTVDYTGNIYGPMRVPTLGGTDPRPEYSPVWSIQNIQFTWSGGKGPSSRFDYELFAGVKNLLNWSISKSVPSAMNNSPIARPADPFDRYVETEPGGRIVPVNDVPPSDPRYNPYGLQFDPDGYSYAPNQGIRGFFGVRFRLH